MPMTQEQIDEISARCSAATDGDTWPTNHPGRWYSEYDSKSDVYKIYADHGDKRVTICYTKAEKDAEFIARARSDTPTMLAEIIWLRAELAGQPKKQTKKNAASFEEFYAVYPNKKSRGSAQKAWNKLNPDDGLVEVILQAIEAQKKTEAWLEQGGRFIPHPATWLNNQRWLDEVVFLQVKGNSKFDYGQRDYKPGELESLIHEYGGDET